MVTEVAVELHRLEQEGRTGTLCVGDGAFHLAEGVVASVECRRTAGLDRLVVESGMASEEDWRRAEIGDPAALFDRPRLAALAMLSVYDAAYFLLTSAEVPEFRPAPAHWLAPVCRVTPRALVREFTRRRTADAGPWPAHLVDRVPVVAVPGATAPRSRLSGGQAEVLAAVDSERTIAAIARDLGRTTYGCLVAVRDLTELGLLEAPARLTGPSGRVVDRAPITPPRRIPGASGPPPCRRVRSEVVPEVWEQVDTDVLVRLLAALKELD